MQCEKCGTECWDNREKVRGGWRGPIYKCKDAACAWVKWPPKSQQGGTPRGAAPRGPKWTWSTLSVTYERCLKLAKKHVLAEQPKALPGDVIAACATLFIAASRDGVADIAPKKPEPKERAGETYDDFPEAVDEDDDPASYDDPAI